ncbi:hypothetical protein CerSpe_004450 [Prunus speciosa]
MKGSKGIWQLYCVVLFLALSFGLSTPWRWPSTPFTKNFVRIVNNLSNNQSFTSHCKSNDNDIGFHTLAPNEQYEWKFRVNMISSTLYFCNFWYKDYHNVFDAFKAKYEFIYDCGGAHCVWKAKDDGIYLTQGQTMEDKKWFDWKKE